VAPNPLNRFVKQHKEIKRIKNQKEINAKLDVKCHSRLNKLKSGSLQ